MLTDHQRIHRLDREPLPASLARRRRRRRSPPSISCHRAHPLTRARGSTRRIERGADDARRASVRARDARGTRSRARRRRVSTMASSADEDGSNELEAIETAETAERGGTVGRAVGGIVRALSGIVTRPRDDDDDDDVADVEPRLLRRESSVGKNSAPASAMRSFSNAVKSSERNKVPACAIKLLRPARVNTSTRARFWRKHQRTRARPA